MIQPQEIKSYAKKKNVPLWRLCKPLGISEATLTRRLRYPLEDATGTEMLDLIDSFDKAI